MNNLLGYLINATLEDVIPYISEIKWIREKIEEISKRANKIEEFIAALEEEIERTSYTRKTDLKIFLMYFRKRVKGIASKERSKGK